MATASNDVRWSVRFKNRRENSLLFLCGGVLTALALVMIPSLLVAMIKDEDLAIIVLPMVLGLIIGVPLIMRYRIATVVRPPDALAMMAVLWVTCFIYGMLPYIMCGLSLVDALFESASGFTTAGVDVVQDFTTLPYCILFWRSTTAWLGGIIIILIFMLLMPMVGGGTRSALGNEMSGSSGGHYNRSMRLRDAAIQFILIYLVLTLIMVFILLLLSFSLYDAVTLSFSTISATGFLSSPVEFTTSLKIVIVIFMFLGATNFYLHYRVVYQKDLSIYKKNEEFKTIVVWCLVMSLILMLLVNPEPFNGIAHNYLDALFVTISASSTTGFSYVDFNSWHYTSMMILYLVAFVGASSGSTAGGIKITRLIIATKAIVRSFSQILRPNTVTSLRLDGIDVPEYTIRNTLLVIVLFTVTILGFALVFMMSGYSGAGSISCSIALISNFGCSVGEFASGYGIASNPLKMVMILMMWMGRLEVLVALAILSPRVWKEQYLNVRHGRHKVA